MSRENLDCIRIFNRIDELNREIDKGIEKLYLINSQLTSTTVQTKDVNVQATSSKDSLSRFVCEKVDMEKEIDMKIDVASDLKRYIRKNMLKIDSEKRYMILCKKYFEKKSLYKIAEEMNIDYENVKHLHRKALEELEKILHFDGMRK